MQITKFFKKTITFVLVLVLIIIVGLCTLKITNYYYLKKNETPAEFLNQVKVEKQQYTKDSLYLNQVLYKMRQEKLFTSNPFNVDSNTVIYIDTILYNSTYNKLVFWGICRLKSLNQKTSKYIYEASGYFAFRENKKKMLHVSQNYGYCIGRYTYSEIHDYFIVEPLHFAHKWTLSRDTKPRYNWNDIRLWTSAEWDDVLGENSYSLENGILIKHEPQDSILFKRL